MGATPYITCGEYLAMAEPKIPRPIPGWTPSTPKVRVDDIDELSLLGRAVAVHFWAPWNAHDQTMDRAIQTVREKFTGRIKFVSCNVDLSENADLCRRCRLASIPALAVLVGGDLRRVIGGCRQPAELARELESALKGNEQSLASKRRPCWAFWRQPVEHAPTDE